jgi:hypothetical protein
MAASYKDYRPESDRHPVWRVQLAQFTWASGVSAAVAKTMEINGKIKVIVGVANDSTNAITYTTTITDSATYQLYTKADWAENATEVVTLAEDAEIYLEEGVTTVTITPSGDPGASGGTFDIVFLGA